MRDDGQAVLVFAERLIRLLDQARTTATYKYAVLLALMDVCMERASLTGEPPQSVTTRQLAEKVLELYWPQTRVFRPEAGVVLRQNRSGQAEILSLILRFQDRHAADPSGTLARARHRAGPAFERLVRDIEWKLVEMPLPRLQQVGADEDRFIYDIAWTREIRRAQFEDEARFDNLIRFVEQERTAEHLIRLNPLLRPIIEAAWTRSVAAWNRDVAPEMELEEFLFGRDRISTLLVRGPLSELQEGRCFYCGDSLRSDPEVDHFLPWARYPTDALENLVVTHRSCNGHKSDHLAALDHVLRWREFGVRHEEALDQIAVEMEWDRRPDRTLGVARALYLRQPPGMKLWHLGTRFVELRRDDVRRAFLAQ